MSNENTIQSSWSYALAVIVFAMFIGASILYFKAVNKSKEEIAQERQFLAQHHCVLKGWQIDPALEVKNSVRLATLDSLRKSKIAAVTLGYVRLKGHEKFTYACSNGVSLSSHYGFIDQVPKLEQKEI